MNIDEIKKRVAELPDHSDLATFSPCRKYRYTLWRTELSLMGSLYGSPVARYIPGYVNFICLNPSTADETTDDNTIRKCVKFTKSWGYGAMCVTNLFAWRSTDPTVLKTLADPIGPENDQMLLDIAKDADLVIAAWGQHGYLFGRSMWIRSMLEQTPLHYLRMGTGKRPEPWHPLYLPDVTQPQPWTSRVLP